ncbi:hypothetical protein GGX14DRAFT_426920 [Mycena pura]|uniref:DUF6534 domain-containing protein n=1 Tax=Mycena pura TaxID=153505 RepID=A0AAD7E0V7_9AGAR|nr:hypothetical protein GGX14DRAFT_426920 [Mycena pura]
MLSQLDLTIGALEVGVLISSTLWGITTVQAYIYATTPSKDPRWIKFLSLHTVFAWRYIYRLTVTFYGQPAIFNDPDWSLTVSATFDGLIGVIVQMFFAYRIRLFSKSWFITSISWFGSVLGLAATLGITILSSTRTVAEFGANYGWLIEGLLSVLLAVDVINTAALSYYLNKGRTGFKSTDVVLEKLVMWTIGAVAATVQLILFKTMPNSTLWIGISLFYAKRSSLCFHRPSLNSRSVIRKGLGVTHQSSDFTATKSHSTPGQHPANHGVHVTVVQAHDSENFEMGRVKHQPDF